MTEYEQWDSLLHHPGWQALHAWILDLDHRLVQEIARASEADDAVALRLIRGCVGSRLAIHQILAYPREQRQRGKR